MELQDNINVNEECLKTTENSIENGDSSAENNQANVDRVKKHKTNQFFRVMSIVLCLSLIVGICYWKRDNIKTYIDKSFISIKSLKDNLNKLNENMINENVVDENTVVTDNTHIGTTQIVQETTIRNDEIVLAEDTKDEEIGKTLDIGVENDIYSMVCSQVGLDLQYAGFVCEKGIIQSINNDNVMEQGLYYYDKTLKMFDEDNRIAVGFYDITTDIGKSLIENSDENVLIVNALNGDDRDKELVCTYNFSDLKPNHFIYKDKYISYYLQDEYKVVYSIQENEINNYNLAFGSLYDYDKKEYLYDENVISEYQVHTGQALFKEEDYKKLETELNKISLEQEVNGFKVENFNITYISPENIKAYLDSKETATFFGYNVNDLVSTFGAGNALEYTENGLQLAKVVDENNGEVDWKSVLTKVGVGSGIIIIGAVLTPITGGASFGCALVTILNGTITPSLCAGLGTLAVNTAIGMINGKDLKSALIGSKNKALNSFANTFMIMSAICSVGVVSGFIKPVACFSSDTLVTTFDTKTNQYNYTKIEDIKVGDYILSYDENTKLFENNTVLRVFSRNVDKTQRLVIGNEIITTTPDHPFFSLTSNTWKSSEDLIIGECIMTNFGSSIVNSNNIDEGNIKVYNLECAKAHTYCVGSNRLVVHNECSVNKFSGEQLTKGQIDYRRSKAVTEAWKIEAEAVNNNISKYNWSPSEIDLITKFGKIPGRQYNGVHIIDVSKSLEKGCTDLISNPDNIVFLTRNNHFYVHSNNWSNATSLDRVVELLPWATDKIKNVMALVP